MTPHDIKNYFGTWREAMKAIRLSRNSYLPWLRQGYVPYHTQEKYYKKTKGELKISEDIPNRYKERP